MSKLKAIIAAFVLTTSFAVYPQNCNGSLLLTAPNERFFDLEDGTVLDKETGLFWMRCSLGQNWTGSDCEGNPIAINWQSALTEARNLTFAKHENWRLPNIKELTSILEYSCDQPALNETIFPGSRTLYWTNTPSIQATNRSWAVNLRTGDTPEYYRYNSLYLRLVRE